MGWFWSKPEKELELPPVKEYQVPAECLKRLYYDGVCVGTYFTDPKEAIRVMKDAGFAAYDGGCGSVGVMTDNGSRLMFGVRLSALFHDFGIKITPIGKVENSYR